MSETKEQVARIREVRRGVGLIASTIPVILLVGYVWDSASTGPGLKQAATIAALVVAGCCFGFGLKKLVSS